MDNLKNRQQELLLKLEDRIDNIESFMANQDKLNKQLIATIESMSETSSKLIKKMQLHETYIMTCNNSTVEETVEFLDSVDRLRNNKRLQYRKRQEERNIEIMRRSKKVLKEAMTKDISMDSYVIDETK